jgi:GNAT superfamily N-acetyltransferase
MPDGPLVVRPATPADSAALAEMSAEFEAYLRSLADDPEVDVVMPQTADTFLTHAFGADPCFACEIARLAGTPAGYLSHFIGYDAEFALRTLFIADVFVREAARGKRVGRALMTSAARIAGQEGAGLIRLTVWDRNKLAIDFYEGLGAKVARDEYPVCWHKSDWPSPG